MKYFHISSVARDEGIRGILWTVTRTDFSGWFNRLRFHNVGFLTWLGWSISFVSGEFLQL